jgi:NAD-dependent SIR2 family protein deacetylase
VKSVASKTKTVFIVGAGFSFYAGLPLTTEFTEALLDLKLKGDKRSEELVQFLRKFVGRTFNHDESAAAKYWPSLEDLFTCIDISANSGHHLGSKYAPQALRTARRALIVRTIRMLRERYSKARMDKDARWAELEDVFETVDVDNSAFISMNWDTVIEEGLARTRGITSIDYGCDPIAVKFVASAVKPRIVSGRKVRVGKLHGSINWLYCDNCRAVFWFEPKQCLKIAGQLFSPGDWSIVAGGARTGGRTSVYRACPECGAAGLGTRLVTFSYRKALDFPMFQKGWLFAEKLLHDADNWIFIGYSLPPADYEFKYLLKRVELSRREPPRIVVISGGADEAVVDATYHNYQSFFGRQIKRKKARRSFFGYGLSGEAVTLLRTMGILRRAK